MRYATVAAVAMLGACSISPSADFIKALAEDNATASIRVQTIYGTIFYCRTNLLHGNVTCDGNGIQLKSDAAQMGIPLTVIPNVTVGQPVMTPAPPVQPAQP